jgi:RimJ/RimL family protein N-acetyltransferase
MRKIMNQLSVTFPSQFESERLILRSYQTGDGPWYYAMSLRNRSHLLHYEADNVAATVANEQAAEALVRELAQAWADRSYFFIGAFAKHTAEFVAQVYVGPLDWKLPEFEIGYFVDVDHEGMGYVTEAVKATLEILFTQLGAHRVRLECDATNLRSIRVAERCQMTLEGYLRANKRDPDGSYRNSLIYGLLKTEFTVNSIEPMLKFTKEQPEEGKIEEISEFLVEHWGSTKIVSKGKITDAIKLPRIVARASDERLVGLLTYQIDRENRSCELVSINSEVEGHGVATKMLGMMENEAKDKGCNRIWLITTNDNPEAAAFYVKRGYRLIRVYLDALKISRELKPQIPRVGKHRISLDDEWEFEKQI